MEQFGDVGALEDNVESFLSQDDGDGGSLFGTLKRNPSEHAETSKRILTPPPRINMLLVYILTRSSF